MVNGLYCMIQHGCPIRNQDECAPANEARLRELPPQSQKNLDQRAWSRPTRRIRSAKRGSLRIGMPELESAASAVFAEQSRLSFRGIRE